MTTITLRAHEEKLAPPDAIADYRGDGRLLYHQVRTYEALQHTPLVMNTYPTGTGKTVAALLRLLHPHQRPGNTLLIAPTNALVEQHHADTQAFIERNGLEMRVFSADAQKRKAFAPTLRAGEGLQRFMNNPLTFADALGLPDETQKYPFVLVTNPDIFYLALYFQYSPKDRRNMFQSLISRFQYVVIDEFHYYDSKQFASFLFFFNLWKLWGYFDSVDTRVCLLSATPRREVYHYLGRVFGERGWALVAPDNEPPEAATLETIPTLTELRMTIVAGRVDEWVQQQQQEVAAWQAADLDSAIISSSLGRISRINHCLGTLDPLPVRITGPEPPAERQRVRPLVLATSTVDIGYNFGRPGKPRQSIDRLVCDARFGDEITQRIGRAGRVLGRAETAIPSEAIVVVGDDAADELKAYDGQCLSRGEWAALVQGLEHLPPKHQLDAYIASYALREAFYPLFQVCKTASPDMEWEVEAELFQTMRAVFAPNSKQKAGGLRASYRDYEQYRSWLNLSEPQRWSMSNDWDRKRLVRIVANFLAWHLSKPGQQQDPDLEFARSKLPTIQRVAASKRTVEQFVEAQVALTKALFSFREAWQGPVVGVYDPRHLLSSEVVNQYDLLHILSNYQVDLFGSYHEFVQASGGGATLGTSLPLYLELCDFREPRLTIGFHYDSSLDKVEFEQYYCRQVVALRGFRLDAAEIGTQTKVPFAPQLNALVNEDWIPCLIVEEAYQGGLLRKVRGSPFYARVLTVTFPNGSSALYKMVTGSAALHVFAALVGYFKAVERATDACCIIL